jgi:hypothetical protein
VPRSGSRDGKRFVGKAFYGANAIVEKRSMAIE